MADLSRVKVWADALIVMHLDPSWSFAFDNAKRRAGLCNYTNKRISVSKYLAGRYEDDEIHQILLHEVAHAIAGPKAGHGPRWKAIGKEIGYEGKRLHDGAIAEEHASWVGHCPAGHEFFRYRAPTRVSACAKCARRFDPKNAIVWVKRA